MTTPISTFSQKEYHFHQDEKHKITAQLYQELPKLPLVLVGIIADYITVNFKLFNAACWKRYFGVGIGDEPNLPDKFYAFWYSPDPIDPSQKVYQTHFPPILRPSQIIYPYSNRISAFVRRIFKSNVVPYTLKRLDELAKASCGEGHLSGYSGYYYAEELFDWSDGFLYEKTQEKSACWLVLRKNLPFRDTPYETQIEPLNELNKRNVQYEKEPSLLDLVTVLLAHHAAGKCYFGDENGSEKEITYDQCKEMVYPFQNRALRIIVGHNKMSGRSSLVIEVINHLLGNRNIGSAAALRKFTEEL